MQTLVPVRRRRYASPFFSMNPFAGFESKSLSCMRTDISETEDSYEFNVELPGFSKDEVTAELKDGYLVVSAESKSETEQVENVSSEKQEETEGEGVKAEGTQVEGEQKSQAEEPQTNWLRRERVYASMTRSYYVGEEIDQDGISAKLENGVLSVSVPKKEQVEEPKKLIEIA